MNIAYYFSKVTTKTNDTAITVKDVWITVEQTVKNPAKIIILPEHRNLILNKEGGYRRISAHSETNSSRMDIKVERRFSEVTQSFQNQQLGEKKRNLTEKQTSLLPNYEELTISTNLSSIYYRGENG